MVPTGERAAGRPAAFCPADTGESSEPPVLTEFSTEVVPCVERDFRAERLGPPHVSWSRSLIVAAGSSGVAGELPEHAVAPAALVDAVLTAVGV